MLDFAPASYQYIGMIVLAFLLLRIDKIGPYFRGLNTMFHESGHAVMALLLTRKFSTVDLHADTSGTCKYVQSGWLRDMLINLAGYPFGILAGWAMLYYQHLGKTDWVFYGLAGWLLLNLLFWVRNKFGWFWILSFGALLGGCWYYNNPHVTWYFLSFSAIVNSIEAVYSSLVILWLSADEPGHSGDAANLRSITYIPAIVWGLLFAGFSIAVALKTTEQLFAIEIVPWF